MADLVGPFPRKYRLILVRTKAKDLANLLRDRAKYQAERPRRIHLWLQSNPELHDQEFEYLKHFPPHYVGRNVAPRGSLSERDSSFNAYTNMTSLQESEGGDFFQELVEERPDRLQMSSLRYPEPEELEQAETRPWRDPNYFGLLAEYPYPLPEEVEGQGNWRLNPDTERTLEGKLEEQQKEDDIVMSADPMVLEAEIVWRRLNDQLRKVLEEKCEEVMSSLLKLEQKNASHWTTGGQDFVYHQCKIDSGACGDVYRV